MWNRVLAVFIFAFISFCLNAEKIQVVTEYLSPYQMEKVDGSLGGYMTEVVEALFDVTGDVPDISVLPWARAMRTATSNKNVMIFSIINTPQRRDQFHWIGSMPSEPIYLWGLKSEFNAPVKDLDRLKSDSIVTIRGSNIYEYLTTVGFANITEVNHEGSIIRMLNRQRVRLIASSKSALKYRANAAQFDLNNLIAVAELKELEIDLSIAFGIQSDLDIVNRYKSAFDLLKTNNRLSEIHKAWYGE